MSSLLSIEYDYDDAVNKIPFSQLYHSISARYMDYGKPYRSGMDYVKTGPIEEYNPSIHKTDIIIMSGASSDHVATLFSCLLSFSMAFPHSSLVFMDYGITEKEQCELNTILRLIHRFHVAEKSNAFLYYRKYNWNSFPDWMHIRDPRMHGGYTWKPISIADVFNQWKAVVMWQDAGNHYHPNCLKGIDAMRKEGAYMPWDPVPMNMRFSDEAFSFLVEHKFIHPFNRSNHNMGGAAYLLFDYRNETCRNRVFIPWVQCAYTRRCMTLKGLTFRQHLPEQGVLSTLLISTGMVSSCKKETLYAPTYWLDRKSRKVIDKQLEMDLTQMGKQLGEPLSVGQVFNQCWFVCYSDSWEVVRSEVRIHCPL